MFRPKFVKSLKLTVVLVIALFAGLTAGAASAKMKIVATTGMVGDMVRNVAGDRADVTVLMGPGVDPHAYRQTRSDVVALGRADVVFYNGLYLEAQLEDLLKMLANRKPVIALAESLPKDKLLSHDTYANKYDPHVWMDPKLWRQIVPFLRDQLTSLDPEGKETFARNAEAYMKMLDGLSAYASKHLTTVAEGRRVLITAHDAFNYFGRAYGYEVIGIQGISTESEAGLQRIKELVDLIVSRGVSAVFVESSVAERNVKALVEGARSRGANVTVGGVLYSDSMGAPGTYEGTYLGMIDHNFTSIIRALGGDAPERGYLGKLAAGS